MATRRDDADWNVLAVGAQGRTGEALAVLSRFGRFRTGGYPQVLLGTVERRSPEALGDGLGELLAADAVAPLPLERLCPVEDAVPFPRDDVTETLCEHFESRAARLCGKTFYVRASLRGLKGRLEHPAVERALGDFLYERASAAGAPPKVRFSDPDIVVVVEVVGRRVGFAFLDREMRAGPLVRVR